jgi:hypothetical protein
MSWFDTALAAYYRAVEDQRAQNAQGVEQAAGAISQGLSHGLGQMRQNQVADQMSQSLANSGAYAPRAGLVSPGRSPITNSLNTIASGVPTAGTAPMSGGGGGMLGYQMRQAAGNMGMENALKRAQIGYYGAHGASALQNAATTEGLRQMQEDQIRHNINTGGAGAKTAAAQAQRDALKQAQKDAEANADTVEKVVKQFNETHSTPAAKYWDAWKNKTGFQGSVQDGKWVGDPNGPSFSPTGNASDAVPMAELQASLDRVKKINDAGGRLVPPIKMPAQSAGGGNAPRVTNAADYAALPPGSAYYAPNGDLKRKPGAPIAQPTSDPDPNSANQVSQ